MPFTHLGNGYSCGSWLKSTDELWCNGNPRMSFNIYIFGCLFNEKNKKTHTRKFVQQRWFLFNTSSSIIIYRNKLHFAFYSQHISSPTRIKLDEQFFFIFSLILYDLIRNQSSIVLKAFVMLKVWYFLRLMNSIVLNCSSINHILIIIYCAFVRLFEWYGKLLLVIVALGCLFG